MKKFAILSLVLYSVCSLGQLNAAPSFSLGHLKAALLCTIGQRSATPFAGMKTKKEMAGTISTAGNTLNKNDIMNTDRPPLKKLVGNTISQDSQTNFYLTIGNVPNIKWARTTYYDEATYNKDKQDLTAYFDSNGALVGTTTVKKAEDLSKPVEKNIKKLYPDATIGQVTYFQDNEENNTDMILYGTQFESKTGYFVELSQGDNKLVVECDKDGDVSLFKNL